MSDGRATADGELSTSETAVPSLGAKTHVPVAAQSDASRGSTRRPDSTSAQTFVVGPSNAAGTGTHTSAAEAKTLLSADDAESGNGHGDGYRFGATVVADVDAAGTPPDGFQMGATVVPGADASADATRIADAVNSFDSDRTSDDLDVHPGESLIGGKFRVIKTLGEGSFGAVYLAEDPQLDRRVAIKVTKVGVLTTRSDVDRFQREAKAAAQLRHPNIVPVYDTGRIGRSSFLVYEFIDGTTLGSRLKEKKKLTPREAAQLMHAISGALGYAHELGIIHRDMKPDNVLLDRQGQPHIADFGLARRDSGEMDKTREGGLMGTPLYMSPEQASGRSHEADARTDVWSLGIMLREMLTGVLPFQGKLTEILIAIQNVEPPGIRTFDPKLPQDLETICQKCLSKDPALRYANGTELAEELDRYLRDEPILARPLSMPARLLRWKKRNPKEAKLIAGIILVLVFGFLASSYFAYDANRESREKALTQLQSLKTSQSGGLSATLGFLKDSRDDIAAQLNDDLSSGQLRPVERNRLLLAKAKLFPEDPGQEERLVEIARTFVELSPDEVLHQVEIVEPFAESVAPTLQEIAHDDARPMSEKRLALFALARLAPGAPNWDADAAEAGAGLLAARGADLPSLVALVEPIRDRLHTAIEPQFASQDSGLEAARVLASLFADRPAMIYTTFVRRANFQQLRLLISPLVEDSDQVIALANADLAAPADAAMSINDRLRLQANAFLVLYAVAPQSIPWEVLAGGTDNSLRTEIIHALHVVPQWQAAAERLAVEADPSVRQALLLALAQYPVTDMPPDELAKLRETALGLYQGDPSPAVHAAARQFVERTGESAVLQGVISRPLSLENRGGRQWFRNSVGQEFAIVNGPVEFLMGAAPDDVEQEETGSERQHRRVIPRSFAIGTHEVTVAQYLEFRQEQFYNPAISPEPNCPMTELSWVDAVRYCRWLSEQEGIPEEEMCYPPDEQINEYMALPANLLERTGYRLPTAAEWEFACRAGTTTSRWIGSRDQTPMCAWYRDNSDDQTHPVGLLEPNCLGLFDTLGNAYEYCEDLYFNDYMEAADGEAVTDGTDTRDGIDRELRGACYAFPIPDVRSSLRDALEPGMTDQRAGFRLARTVRAE